MKIVPSDQFLGPHHNEYRLPNTSGADFEEAVSTLIKFVEYYTTESPKGSSLKFEMDLSSFNKEQQHKLQPLIKKKGIKII